MKRFRTLKTFKKIILFFIIILSLCFIFGVLFFTKAQLIISEVYFAGTDERIEITNISDQDFSGNIILSGAKSSNINLNNINIASQEQAIFGDNMTMILDHNLDNILENKLVQKAGLGLSIYDTRDLEISLLFSSDSGDMVLDNIFANTDELAKIKSYKAALQKIQSGAIFITTGSQNFSDYNIAEGYIANPGMFYNLNHSTGTTQETGTINTGNISGEVCLDFNTKIKITEIFPGDEKYPAYIEIQALEDFGGSILFSGDALLSPITFNTTLRKDDYIIISNIANGWLSTLDMFIDSSFQLDSSGSHISIYGQSGQLLDSISLQFGTGSSSLYEGSTGACYRDFSRINAFSPGFSEELLIYFSSGFIKYIEVEKIVEIETIVYINTGCDTTEFDCSSCTTTGNIEEPGTGTTTTGTSQVDLSELTNGQFIQITSIVYDPDGSDVGNEIVVLKSQVSYPVNIDHLRLHSLSRTTNNRIYGDIPANSEVEFVGNYRFPNSANCVELLSGDVILDLYCYDPADNTSTEETTEDDETSQDLPEDGQENNTMTQYKISIENLVYDVEGSDTDREQVTLILQSDSNLPVLGVEELSELKLMIGTRKTKLFYEDLNNLDDFSSRNFGEKKTFTGNFRFPNSKNTCVALMRNEHIFDTHCYEIPREEKTDAENLKETIVEPKPDIKIISILPDPLGNDAGAELITLLYTNPSNLSETQILELDDNFRLKINTTNKKITGTLTAATEEIILGNFSFPNKAACVSLTFKGEILDTFCYENPKEGFLFQNKNGIIEQLSTIDLSVLQKTSFKKTADNICLIYDKQDIHCKNYKTSTVDSNELKLYKNYVSVINEYLSNNRSILFFRSPLQYYQELLKQAKAKIKSGQNSLNIYGKNIAIYDIDAQAKELIFATPTEILQRRVLDQIMPETIRKQYYFLVGR